MKITKFAAFLLTLVAAFTALAVEPPLKVLIIDGQNNHDWKATTPCMKGILDTSGRFQTTVSNTPDKDAPQTQWDTWRPKFQEYDCVLLNYNGQMWPEEVKKDFVDYVRNGGGVVLIHAANNAFGGWKEYEQMAGLLWRWWTCGYSLYVDENGKVNREEPGQGRMMGHGDWAGWYEWTMTVRDPEHPITRGMPQRWLHAKDELYHGQRGPAENLHILLTAYSQPGGKHNGTGKNEPIIWWTSFGKGRVVTTVMGHDVNAMKCAGFHLLLQRSCEWAATGHCTIPIPPNFPSAEKTTVDIHGASVRGSAKAWQFTGDLLEDIMPRSTKLPDVAVNGSTMNLALPPFSITVLSLGKH